jgi:hypothetical protein
MRRLSRPRLHPVVAMHRHATRASPPTGLRIDKSTLLNISACSCHPDSVWSERCVSPSADFRSRTPGRTTRSRTSANWLPTRLVEAGLYVHPQRPELRRGRAKLPADSLFVAPLDIRADKASAFARGKGQQQTLHYLPMLIGCAGQTGSVGGALYRHVLITPSSL